MRYALTQLHHLLGHDPKLYATCTIMTIFARRRLQSMLDELTPILAGGKGKDILQRLNDKKNVEQALPAEMELALLWAIKSIGDLEVEPEWWGDSKRPDAITKSLVAGRTTAIEIAAPNDNAISGEQAMDAVALQIGAVVNRSKKGASDYLYFQFSEESGYVNGRYMRRRLAPQDFKITDQLSTVITNWISSERYIQEPLRIQQPELDVVVEFKKHRQIRFHNTFSTMPSETHSLEDNPLFELLRRKKRQLRAAKPGTLRMIFLADAGSALLNRIGQFGELDPMKRRVSGKEIILHFIAKNAGDIDAIVTFSPHKEALWLSGRNSRNWNITYFGSPALSEPPKTLNQLANNLPSPNYEGYQARSLFRQGAFSPEGKGQYLGMTITSKAKGNGTSIKLPARLLLDLLAGRITEEYFRRYLNRSGTDMNIFERWLNMGMSINGAEMATRDIDEDDDHLILHFADDAAARPFNLPKE